MDSRDERRIKALKKEHGLPLHLARHAFFSERDQRQEVAARIGAADAETPEARMLEEMKAEARAEAHAEELEVANRAGVSVEKARELIEADAKFWHSGEGRPHPIAFAVSGDHAVMRMARRIQEMRAITDHFRPSPAIQETLDFTQRFEPLAALGRHLK